MKAKAKTIEECTSLFEIEVSKETVEKALEEVYDEITKIASIPGYRVGKAPQDLVKKVHKNQAREEALNRLVKDAYLKAVEEHKVDPVSLPEISEVSFAEDRPLYFKARVDTRPKFRLKKYKGLKVEKKTIKIEDEDIDKTLENLRSVNAKYISVGDRDLKMGDYAICDLRCFVEGKEAHKNREGIWLFIDKESFIPTLTEKMVGMKKGEERQMQVKLPEKYPVEGLGGKDAAYQVKVKEIKEKVLPNLDDEFAKDLGKSHLDALKKEIRHELEERMRYQAQVDMENRLLRQLVEDNVFKVPNSLVKRQLRILVEDAKSRLLNKGLKKEDLDSRDKEFEQKFKEDAVHRARLLFILDEIARLENIDLNDGELENAFKSISAQTGKPLGKVKSYYEKEGLVNSLKDKIVEEKTIAFLVKNAEILEK